MKISILLLYANHIPSLKIMWVWERSLYFISLGNCRGRKPRNYYCVSPWETRTLKTKARNRLSVIDSLNGEVYYEENQIVDNIAKWDWPNDCFLKDLIEYKRYINRNWASSSSKTTNDCFNFLWSVDMVRWSYLGNVHIVWSHLHRPQQLDGTQNFGKL